MEQFAVGRERESARVVAAKETMVLLFLVSVF